MRNRYPLSSEIKVRQTLLLESTPEEGLLKVSTKGNWFEMVAKTRHFITSFGEVAQSLSYRSVKGYLGKP